MGGRSKPMELATRGFEKQGDAIAFFKAVLNGVVAWIRQ